MRRPVFVLLLILCGTGSLLGQVPDSAAVARALLEFRGPVGWYREDTLRAYAGNALFDLVDGGAGLYLEYGFVRAYVVRFAGEESRVSVEVYEMKGPSEAFGLYSYLAAGSIAGRADHGQEGGQGEGFILFWKGRYVVAVTTVQGEVPKALEKFAASVDRKLPAEGEVPAIVRVFRDELDASDVVYFSGVLGYQKQRLLLPADLLHVERGVLGKMDKCDAAVLFYRDEASCRVALHAAIDSFSVQSGAVLDRSEDNGLLTINGAYYAVLCAGGRLLQVRGTGMTDVVRVADRVKSAFGR
jgi:hypothetical protein